MGREKEKPFKKIFTFAAAALLIVFPAGLASANLKIENNVNSRSSTGGNSGSDISSPNAKSESKVEVKNEASGGKDQKIESSVKAQANGYIVERETETGESFSESFYVEDENSSAQVSVEISVDQENRQDQNATNIDGHDGAQGQTRKEGSGENEISSDTRNESGATEEKVGFLQRMLSLIAKILS